MSDRIRTAIAARIYEGVLRPGERLVELELAKEFNTSQTPVREALRELEQLRLVESEPYRGTRVRSVSNREMAEAFAVRGVLEQMAAELIVARGDADLAPLEEALAGISDSAHAGDGVAYSAHNFTFHRNIVTASGSQVLLTTWESLAFETRMRINVARSSPADLIARIAVHQEILDALAARDGLVAGRLLRAHSDVFSQMWSRRPPDEAIPTATDAIPAGSAAT